MSMCKRIRGGISEGAEARFWKKVAVGGKNACWMWLGGVCGKAAGPFYGYFDLGPHNRTTAHRALWILLYGYDSIPDGYDIRHTCDVPLCCNPSHLWLGTAQDDADDKVRKGRQCRGDDHWTVQHPDRWERTVRPSFLSRKSVRKGHLGYMKWLASHRKEHAACVADGSRKFWASHKRQGFRGKAITRS